MILKDFKGREFQIDNSDFEKVRTHTWTVSKGAKRTIPKRYVTAGKHLGETGPKTIMLHRLIVGAKPGQSSPSIGGRNEKRFKCSGFNELR